MTDLPPKTEATVVTLPQPGDKGPITSFDPQIENFPYYLAEKGYAHSTIQTYCSAFSSVLTVITHTSVPEKQIIDAMMATLSGQRRELFKAAWRLFHDWLVPFGYRITPLPKLVEGRPRKPMSVLEAEAARINSEPKLKPPLRCGFRGYGDLFGFRKYLASAGFSEDTITLYFRIVADALHFLEGDSRASADTIKTVLGKESKRYDYLDPENIRFLRAWAHLQDYWKPFGYDVTTWVRPPGMWARGKKPSALESSTEEKAQSGQNDTPEAIQNPPSNGEDGLIEDF